MTEEQYEEVPPVRISMTWDEFLKMIQPDLDKINSFTAKAKEGRAVHEDDFFDAVRAIQALKGFLEMVPDGEFRTGLIGMIEDWDQLSKNFNFIIE